MKRILGITMVLGLVGALTFIAGCSKGKAPLAKESSGKETIIDLGKGVKLTMVLIPAGKFMMGSPASENGQNTDETQHEVNLTKPFYMGSYEVTQEQWEMVMGNNPSETVGGKLPVTDVSWEDCQEFINKLNSMNKGRFRLSSEAEWEYACRAGTKTIYSFGDSLTKSDAFFGDGDVGSPKPVGSYKPNAFGLYDMHGNVNEWCEDRLGEYPAESVTDPKGANDGPFRVLRGGSFADPASLARSFKRNYLSPAYRNVFSGFRLAKDK